MLSTVVNPLLDTRESTYRGEGEKGWHLLVTSACPRRALRVDSSARAVK